MMENGVVKMSASRGDLSKMVHEGRECVGFTVSRQFTDDIDVDFNFKRSREDKKVWEVIAVVMMQGALSPVVVSAVFSVYMSDQPLVDVASIGFQAVMPSMIQAVSDLQAIVAGLSKLI